MRVEGIEGTKIIFNNIANLSDDEDNYQTDNGLASEYVISNKADIKGLRLLLLHKALANNFRIIQDDKSYTILEWIDCNIQQVSVIYDYLSSNYFSICRLNGTQFVPVLTDNQLLFYLKHMIYKVQEYGYLIQQSVDFYQGNDDGEIFSKYDMSIEDLTEINQRAGLNIRFNRDHIVQEAESRPDAVIMKFDY